MPTQEEIDNRFYAWYQAMELSHAMLMSGLRYRVGPEGDVIQAYREWYQNYRQQKWNEIRAAQESRNANLDETLPSVLDPSTSQARGHIDAT